MAQKLPAKIGYKESPGIKRAFDNYGKTISKEMQDKFRESLVVHPDKLKLSGDKLFYTIQGEGVTTGEPAVFMRLHICNLMCLHPDTEITMGDFSKKKLKDIREEDVVLGVKKQKPNKNILVQSKVLKVWKAKNKKTIKINNSLICSEDHPIYYLERRAYVEASKLAGKTGKSIFTVDFITINDDYIKGYLSGTAFADGSIYNNNKQFSFASVDQEYAKRIQEYIKIYSGKQVNIHEYRYSGEINQVYDIRWMNSELVPLLKDTYFSNKDWFAGFFAAWFDSDGSWSKQGNVQITRSRDFDTLQDISHHLYQHFSISSHINTRQSKITKSGILHIFVPEGSRFEKLKFLLSINICLRRKLHLDKSILLQDTPLVIDDSEYDGELIDLQTESGNLFANNLLVHNCTWCDAYYTWQRESPEFWSESKDYPIPEVAAMIEAAWTCENKTKKRLVITGGEPTLQRNQITKLLPLLPDWKIEVETNGTLLPTPEMLERIQFNCSPKLKNSGNLDSLRLKPAVLQALNKVNTMFKFVVMTPEDLDEVERDFVIGCNLDPNKIAVMPQGVSAKEINENMVRVAEACKKKGYRLFTRLHVLAWGGALRRV